jgi:hypothetical protein
LPQFQYLGSFVVDFGQHPFKIQGCGQHGFPYLLTQREFFDGDSSG